mmetsp:Transcript_58929/g.135165  ORF Transcript_58929/g.135165 Transcript_58929/m.135165 type:complete len:127 (-) Transcript_58929:346-726(-)
MVDPAVLRRLPLALKIDWPTVSSRQSVLRCLLQDEPMAAEIDIMQLASETDGYSGSDLEQLCRTAALRPVQDLFRAELDNPADSGGPVAAGVLRKLVLDDFRYAMHLVLPSLHRFTGHTSLSPAPP